MIPDQEHLTVREIFVFVWYKEKIEFADEDILSA